MSRSHWDSVYGVESVDELGWWEPSASTLALVTSYSTPDDPVVDVGGGASPLALELVRRGYRDVTVLDISERALEASRAASSEDAGIVDWIRADVTAFRSDRRWKLWHDRAVFHFLVEESDREAYRSTAVAAVEPGGILIVATFAPDGPERCAGLPVCRYDVDALAREFAPDFDLVEGRRLCPASAVGDQRPYVVAVLRHTGAT